ncbi:hypothetical protein NP233_g4619 [Leucocoprinus birnbaumii]|uniref:Uncharacterized protein n=1 Tax=Leucocoprinus birnbaumii TaxID=56174 RepID=A0AAD5VX18_9AGAR|nr:hypothetical protein NP233_g4619 [Leucocoprinus birnbaumii]
METSVAGPSQPVIEREGGSSPPRPQAGPLPRKRGEIGYVEGQDAEERSGSSSPDVVLPARHPADRDVEQGAVETTDQPTASTQATTPPTTTSETASTVDSVSASKQKGRQLLGLFKCKCNHTNPTKVAGIQLPTLTRFILQVLVLAGTIVGWVFVTRFLTTTNEDGNTPGGPSSTIFMHVIFSIASLGQLLLLERRIFRMRAERYSYLHPGEVLPSFRNRHRVPDDIIALSPWNRPPLPTYAAILAESGRGTGDVEDNAIAQQPPPAYGNTRGSTFLLSGFLNEEQRLQRPASVHSASSVIDRPKSYTSRDDEWEEIQNAERARRLEETLAKLERSVSRSSRER